MGSEGAKSVVRFVAIVVLLVASCGLIEEVRSQTDMGSCGSDGNLKDIETCVITCGAKEFPNIVKCGIKTLRSVIPCMLKCGFEPPQYPPSCPPPTNCPGIQPPFPPPTNCPCPGIQPPFPPPTICPGIQPPLFPLIPPCCGGDQNTNNYAGKKPSFLPPSPSPSPSPSLSVGPYHRKL